ncbi:MAG: carboxypeptidase regulatory-like domain-containing protein [Bacteroidia bacterium]
MKRLLLSFSLLSCLISNAQDGWDSLITIGPNQTRFNLVKVFKNKIYVTGSDSLGTSIHAFSSSTGNYGSFADETGLAAVLQGGNEGALTASTANNSLMFYGSGVQYNGVNNFLPQVYKFDGATYSAFGTIPHDVTGVNRITAANKPYISAMAQYSPTGSNDTVYAFVCPDSSYLGATIWKSPVSSPNWINVSKFDSASGIGIVNDAIVWHRRLYIATSGRDSGGTILSYILSTANGVSWDTVAKTSVIFASVGVPNYWYSGCNFMQLEVHNDTLYTGLSANHNGYPLWYTADSLTINPTWHNLPSVGGGNCWGEICDIQSAFGKLWFGVNVSPCRQSGWVPRKKQQHYSVADYGFDANGSTLVTCYRNGQYYTSSSGTGIDYWMSNWHYKLAFMNNALYAGGAYLNWDTYRKYGNLWRVIPPTAAFSDSSSNGVNFCSNNLIFLNDTSLHTLNGKWRIDGTDYASVRDTSWNPPTAGTHTVTFFAYNGDPYWTNFVDSITKTITVLQSPIVDSTVAKYLTVCQGQPDSVTMYTQLGTPPFKYYYENMATSEKFNNTGNPAVLIPNSTPSSDFYGTIIDANGCVNNAAYVMIFTNTGDSLSGLIRDTSLAPVTAGQVYLFKLNPLNPHQGDTAGVMTLTNGTYYFPSVFYGNYIVKAIADTNNPLYKTAVGTYYSNKVYPFQWDSALLIQHHTCVSGNISGNDIKILQMPAPVSGPGVISGRVTKDSSYTGARYIGGINPLGAPLKGVDIKLGKNPGGSPAARTTTDANGDYSFSNVPVGKYKIYIDIPNYGMDSVRQVDLTVSPNSTNNDYYVDSNSVRVIPIGYATAGVCQGDSIFLQGAYQTTAGVYLDTINVNGHDSLLYTTVSMKPLPTLTVTSASDSVCIGGSVLLSANGNGTFYQWSANAGSATTSTVSVSPTTNTIYTVTTNLNGCSSVGTVSIIAKSCIGIQAMNQTGFAAYPNPATDKLFIETSRNAQVKLVSIIGQVMLEQSIPAGKAEISLGSFPPGVYEMVINSNGTTTTQKLVINR